VLEMPQKKVYSKKKYVYSYSRILSLILLLIDRNATVINMKGPIAGGKGDVWAIPAEGSKNVKNAKASPNAKNNSSSATIPKSPTQIRKGKTKKPPYEQTDKVQKIKHGGMPVFR
jgi:hypothetical protein